MNLFDSAADLGEYLFRITDNGGATHDRITVTFSDGSGVVCSETTLCAHIEEIDPRIDAEAVETGEARDLRWIDLDPLLQSAIVADANTGFADWVEAFTPPVDRESAADYGSADSLTEWLGVGLYGTPGAYRIRNDWDGVTHDESDYGPYDTLAAALRGTLPDPGSYAGEEYHSTEKLWDTEGGPREPWDSESEPATPFEVQPWAIDRETSPGFLDVIAEARDPEHAAEIGAAWIMENPELAKRYQPAYINKVDRVVHRMELV